MTTREIDIHANLLFAATFSHPSEVLQNPVLSPAEKRCVLAEWASDAFAVRNNPWLRQLPGSPDTIPLKDILGALRRLDDEEDVPPPPIPGGAALRPPRVEPMAEAVGF
ncbi:hypothetical protein HNQ36_005098 [Afipia massiliensis]|uniref:Uncharacterized protein n=1 Tax=Afipia massiliensis TaxID=211460 RepID=A0A840N911_9BRAD|nr:hypothetical protein [Afipia massiliensis]MBB5055087.1 hypothetical protein [Afipia massiliensis]